MRSAPFVRLLALFACLLCTLAASAPAPDWSAVAGVEEVVVVTTNEDGTPRETTIWLVVVDGQGYIRTSRSTRWGDNVERDPDIVLRIEEQEHPARAFFVEDEALRERIVRAFREKYGWFDGMVNFMRGRHPRIMRLEPRE
jgi:hypothetical protein